MPSSTKPKTTPKQNTGIPVTGYTLSPALDEQVARRAAELGITPELMVRIAVADWLRQQVMQG